jgi:hypothetical protein
MAGAAAKVVNREGGFGRVASPRLEFSDLKKSETIGGAGRYLAGLSKGPCKKLPAHVRMAT